MKRFKQTFAVLIMTAALSLAGTQVYAQSSADSYRKAYKIYQKAKSLSSTKQYEQAIKKYKKAIQIAQKGGGSNNEQLVKMAKQKIPGISLNVAIIHYKDFQGSHSMSDLNKAIDAFKKAEQTGKKYGNDQVAQQATSDATKMLYIKSVMQYSNEKYDAALSTINKAIDRNPNYAQAYYQKGLIYKKMDGHQSDIFTAFDKAIEIGQKNNKSSIVRKAKENASGQLVYEGGQQLKSHNPQKAISLLKKSLNYNSESADAYYWLAKANNNLGNYSTALGQAKKGLSYAGSGQGDQAKFYFAKGKALSGLGQNSQACEAFSKAAYGKFKDSAQYKMKNVLKCQE